MKQTKSPRTVRASRLVLTNEGLAWLGVAFLLGIVGWFKSINLVLILSYMMIALLCLNGWLARQQTRRIVAVRTIHPPLFAGETTTLQVAATNVSHRAATASVEDRHEGDVISWFLLRLPGNESVTCTGSRVYPARGRFASALWVTSAFPLGLVRGECSVGGGLEVIVLPAVGEVDIQALRHWLLRQAGGDGRTRRVLRRVTTDQADVRGVRPYRPGDPIRGIHWRSSARRGELMVREYDAAPNPELILVVEPWLPTDSTASHQARLEATLSLAATIARAWSSGFETRVSVVVAGLEESAVTARPADAALREALIPLADVAGGNSFEVLGPSTFDRALQRAARLVVSSRRDSPYAAALTRSTGRPFLAVSPLDRPAWYHSAATVAAGGL